MSGSFWLGGFLSGGFLSGGLCPGFFCPVTICIDILTAIKFSLEYNRKHVLAIVTTTRRSGFALIICFKRQH